jgi:hypothetical protein
VEGQDRLARLAAILALRSRLLDVTQQRLGTVIGVVLLLEDRVATNQAAAFSCSIMAIVVATLLAAHLLLRLLGARNVSLIR